MTNLYIQKIVPGVNSANNTTAIFTVTNNNTFSIQNSSPVSAMPLPQNQAESQQLIKVTGNTRQITQQWIIKPETVNNATPNSANSGFIAVSTLNSGLPLTVFDQIFFLEKYIVPILLTDTYQITLADSCTLGTVGGNGYYAPVFTNIYYQSPGTITEMDTSMSGTQPVTFTATMGFIVGTNITTLEANTPSSILNFAAVTGGSTGQISLSWSAPTDAAGGLVPASGYHIYRKGPNFSSFYTLGSPTITTSSSTLLFTDTGLQSGKTYYYEIVAANSNGEGIYSTEVSAVAK